jgi:hypothetical protein
VRLGTSLTSWRKPGPITTGHGSYEERDPLNATDRFRGMGPGIRQAFARTTAWRLADSIFKQRTPSLLRGAKGPRLARTRWLAMTGARHDSAFSRRNSPEFCLIHCPRKVKRAQGRPGGRCTRGSRAKKICASAKTTGTGGNNRPSLRSGFTAYTRSCVCKTCQNVRTGGSRKAFGASRKLGACMGAPGPHDFAVRGSCRTSIGTPTSTAFRTTFVTTRTPLHRQRNGATNPQFTKKRK